MREGVESKGAAIIASKDAVKAMGAELLFDYLAIRLNRPKARDTTMIINASFTDTGENYVLALENGVLNDTQNTHAETADTTITLTRSALDQILISESSIDQKAVSGELGVEGSREKLDQFFALLDRFEFWFNVVTP